MHPILRARAREAPSRPGVYCVLGDDDELIYIGKAVDLHRRLSDWARGTTHPDDVRVHRLVRSVRDVRWLECTDERDALCREADLIVALAPRLNAVMRFDAYTYVCVHEEAEERFVFRLAEGGGCGAGRCYGAFPHLGKGKASWRAVRTNGGYSALLRLLWVRCTEPPARYRLPAKLRGTSPPAALRLRVGASPWASLPRELHDFLSGRSARLLRGLAEAIKADDVPAFMRSPLADDLQAADEFFRLGPRALLELRRRHDLPPGPIEAGTFATALERELRDRIGLFRSPTRVRVRRDLPRRIRGAGGS